MTKRQRGEVGSPFLSDSLHGAFFQFALETGVDHARCAGVCRRWRKLVQARGTNDFVNYTILQRAIIATQPAPGFLSSPNQPPQFVPVCLSDFFHADEADESRKAGIIDDLMLEMKWMRDTQTIAQFFGMTGRAYSPPLVVSHASLTFLIRVCLSRGILDNLRSLLLKRPNWQDSIVEKEWSNDLRILGPFRNLWQYRSLTAFLGGKHGPGQSDFAIMILDLAPPNQVRQYFNTHVFGEDSPKPFEFARKVKSQITFDIEAVLIRVLHRDISRFFLILMFIVFASRSGGRKLYALDFDYDTIKTAADGLQQWCDGDADACPWNVWDGVLTVGKKLKFVSAIAKTLSCADIQLSHLVSKPLWGLELKPFSACVRLMRKLADTMTDGRLKADNCIARGIVAYFANGDSIAMFLEAMRSRQLSLEKCLIWLDVLHWTLSFRDSGMTVLFCASDKHFPMTHMRALALPDVLTPLAQNGLETVWRILGHGGMSKAAREELSQRRPEFLITLAFYSDYAGDNPCLGMAHEAILENAVKEFASIRTASEGKAFHRTQALIGGWEPFDPQPPQFDAGDQCNLLFMCIELATHVCITSRASRMLMAEDEQDLIYVDEQLLLEFNQFRKHHGTRFPDTVRAWEMRESFFSA